MYIGRRYLNGMPVDGRALNGTPMKSEKIEEIFRRVKKRVGE